LKEKGLPQLAEVLNAVVTHFKSSALKHTVAEAKLRQVPTIQNLQSAWNEGYFNYS
jgi:hypothetical protein